MVANHRSKRTTRQTVTTARNRHHDTITFQEGSRLRCLREKNATGFWSRIASRRLVGIQNRATLLGCILGICLMASTQAHSALVVTVAEVGSDVVFSWGDGVSTLDLTGLTGPSPSADFSAIIPFFSGSSILIPTFTAANADTYTLPSPANPFGTSSRFAFGVPSGSLFGWGNASIVVPKGYSGGIIPSGKITALGSDFASLGLTPGLIPIAAWGVAGGDSLIQMQIVPEPRAFLPLAALSLLGGFFLWRRRRKVAATAQVS